MTTSCGTGTCDDSGPYVACKPAANPCAPNTTKVCVDEDPHAVYWQDSCGNLGAVAFPCGGTSACQPGANGATCALVDSCAGNASTTCDPADLSRVYWLDHCGVPTGSSIPCGANAACSDAGGAATCEPVTDVCGGNTTLACNPADPSNLYWRDACDQLTGATVPCGAGLECMDDDAVYCGDPTPCDGPAQAFCDPQDLSVVKWLDGCGKVKASTVPCGASAQCTPTPGGAECVSIDTCGGNTTPVCLDDDPGHVYWLDGCGALTGSTIPCGVGTCDDSSGTAACTILGTCADTVRRVCDPEDPTTVRLENDCGEDLGVFSVCKNGKQCSEATPGQAACACVPTDEVACFGTDFLYEPSGVRKLDSCGNPNGEIVTTCKLGEVCFYETPTTPVCATSLEDASGPMGHRGCSFIDYLRYKTSLPVDCRCRRHAADKNDFYGYDTSGNVHCMTQENSWSWGFTVADGPSFAHILHNFNGGGVLDAQRRELFTVMHYTDSQYQKTGMVIAYNVDTGARRIVSGRYPGTDGMYQMFGSGYQSDRAVGVQRLETQTFTSAWDLEQAADGMLYVWGSLGGGNQEIIRVHPDTGARTLVWRQVLEGDAEIPAFGQCFSTREKATFPGGYIPVQLRAHAFAMGPDGAFYLGFANADTEGNGIVRISPDGATCTVVSRWNGSMGEVGGGAPPQYSLVEGFGIHDGALYASVALGSRLLKVDLATGSRSLVALAAGSPELTPGQSTMFWDDTRDLLITAGGIQSFLGVAIDLATGKRQSLFRVGPGQLIPGVAPFDVNAHGAIDNGNYMGYGAMAMDPTDNDVVYLVVKWGLIAYEISTGNSYVMSQ